ncbi:surface lipoprotein assembly modifier [Martelella mediterranea]|uniref:surface lipoprotein assembly modifier n=1 Tax=Martelella mediterranea TaxID=293089 RepID=UPI001E5081F3|nr:surface lipoprotein assembly modifier [Martelella mediterranea]MCD1635387.1 surface lipoprotein assembly modifier [Martelella mediterranea]
MANRRFEPRAGNPARGLGQGLKRIRRDCLFAFTLGFFMISAPQWGFAKKSTVTGFDAVRVLVEYGQYENAMSLAESFATDQNGKALAAAFTQALILEQQGRLPEAASALRAILSQNPEARNVRRELASVLYEQGEGNASLHHFELLAGSANSADERAFYERLAAKARTIRPWSLGGYLSIAPSTNITEAPDADLVYIGGIPILPAEKKSGIGYGYGLNGSYRFDLDEVSSITIGGGVNGDWYRDTSFNTSYFDSFVDYRREIGDWTVTGGLVGQYVMKGEEPYRWSLGPAFSLRHNMGRNGVTTLRGMWRKLDYHDRDELDGSETVLGISHLYAISSASSVRFGGNIGYVDAANDTNSYVRLSLNAQYFREWSFGAISDISIFADDRKYQDITYLAGEKRSDQRIQASLGITLRNLAIQGFAPRIEYAYTQNFSNVDVYDFSKNTLSTYLTKKF